MGKSNVKKKARGFGLRSIKVKMIATIMLLGLVPLGVISLYTSAAMRSNVSKLANDVSTQKLNTAQKEVELLINETMDGVKIMAKDPYLRAALVEQSTTNCSIAKGALKNAQDAFVGGETATFLFDTTCMQIARNDNGNLNNIADRPYAKEAIKGNIYYSDVSISKATGEGTLFMSAPVFYNSRVVGGVAKSAPLSALNESIREICDEDTNITVLDRVGNLAVSSLDYDMSSGELIDMSAEKYFVLAHEKGSGTYTDNIMGSKKLVSYMLDENTGWTIVCMTEYNAIMGPYINSLITSFIVIAIAAIAIIIFGNAFALSFSKPIGKVMEFAGDLAEGDFTTEPLKVKNKDEIGAMSFSLNNMYESNLQMIKSIGDGSKQVAQSAKHVSENAAELQKQFEEVATAMSTVNDAMTSIGAATEEVSASANEVNNSVEKLAQETQVTKDEAVSISEKAKAIEQDGRKSTEYALSIAQKRGEEMESAIEDARVVAEIANMAGAISGIAEQINLLSLNATIEAARAGEHGRGFAVVAEEINKLADQTKSSVEQIQHTVDKIQAAFTSLENSSNGLLAFMRETVTPDYQKFITIGQEYGADAAKFGQLSDTIAEMVDNISLTMEQVTNAVGEIAENATATAQSSSDVSETVDDAASRMEEMGHMVLKSQEASHTLDELVNRFKIVEDEMIVSSQNIHSNEAISADQAEA
ncbi:MAG: methyl-accepting chemotaxis protein [Pseudobutyrivibrio sp.]|nr:methyl-accepting chemotaxis protein [Pseudobutyrivibrio sp.]